jgi:hypothetical protein
MIGEFLHSRTGIILLSIIWGLGLSTLFKKPCGAKGCTQINYQGPGKDIIDKIWTYGDHKCYRLKPYVVDCNSKK